MKSRVESNKKYYDIHIKPFREWKPSTLWHQCLFCGMITRKEKFEDQNFKGFVFKSYKRWGRRFEFYVDQEETEEYLRLIQIRVLNFLKNCVSRGLITKEEIARVFDLFTEQEKVDILTPLQAQIPRETLVSELISVFRPTQTIKKTQPIKKTKFVEPVKVYTSVGVK